MGRAFAERVRICRARFSATANLLDAVSYRGVLARGFALVRDEADSRCAAPPRSGRRSRLRIEFADGEVPAVAGGRGPRRRQAPGLRRRRGGRRAAGQERRRAGVAVLRAARGRAEFPAAQIEYEVLALCGLRMRSR